MAAGASATPGQSDSLPNSPPPGASPSTLAGAGAEDTQPGPAQGGGDEGLKQAVQSVRQILMQIMDLSRQFPAAASSLRAAQTGLRAALRQIITNPGSPEPPSPQIGG